jgi:hypothetical protein
MNCLQLSVVALATQLLACTANGGLAPTLGVETKDASAVTSAGDGGIDCHDLVTTEWGKVARACLHEAPIGAVAAEEPGHRVVVRMNGAEIASYEQCPCVGNETVLVIPAGAQPQAYLPRGLTIEASRYDQTCQTNTDCVSVYEGSRCGAECGCDNATINRQEQVRYSFDRARDCLSESAFFGPVCNCPSYGRPVCRQGRCVLGHDTDLLDPKGNPITSFDGGSAAFFDAQTPSGHDGGGAVDAAINR